MHRNPQHGRLIALTLHLSRCMSFGTTGSYFPKQNSVCCGQLRPIGARKTVRWLGTSKCCLFIPDSSSQSRSIFYSEMSYGGKTRIRCFPDKYSRSTSTATYADLCLTSGMLFQKVGHLMWSTTVIRASATLIRVAAPKEKTKGCHNLDNPIGRMMLELSAKQTRRPSITGIAGRAGHV